MEIFGDIMEILWRHYGDIKELLRSYYGVIRTIVFLQKLSALQGGLTNVLLSPYYLLRSKTAISLLTPSSGACKIE